MSSNIEIKAHCQNLDEVVERLHKLGATLHAEEQQTDTFFKVQSGRLKLRERSPGEPYLIPYLRSDISGPKQSQYALIKMSDVATEKYLLSQVLGVRGVVEKKRAIYLFQNVRIHLDNVNHLGTFIELEGVISPEYDEVTSQHNVDFLIKKLNISDNELVKTAYIDMLELKTQVQPE